MAQHKAATEVTIAAREERSEFAAWIDRNWKLMAALAVLIAAAILVFQYLQVQKSEALAQSWSRVWDHAEPSDSMAFFSGDAAGLASIFPEVQDTQAGPWALYLQAKVHAENREYDAAVSALMKLQQTYPDHPLVRQRFKLDGSETGLTVVENMLQTVRDQGEWFKTYGHLLENPAPPADAPRVRLQTAKGAVVVQMYTDKAPQHTDNFLKLVREGYYDGTRFHRVEPNFMIQGGDPNSKEDDRSLWGIGGPDYTIPKEENDLSHFVGYLAGAKLSGAVESSGSQFYITVAPSHHLDGEHVIFGKVVEGMDAVHAIAADPLDTNPMRRGQPVDPVAIESASVL